MAEVARRRADQLGDLVRVLEFRAINFNDRVSVSEEHLSGSFDDVSLARSSWSEKQQGSERSVWAGHSGLKYLIDGSEVANGSVLSNYAMTKSRFKVHCLNALAIGIKWNQSLCVHLIDDSGCIDR